MPTRRRFLAAAALGFGAVAGCLDRDGNARPPPGSVVVRNDAERSKEVSVVVRMRRRDRGSGQSNDSLEAPDAPEPDDARSFDVPAGDTVKRASVVTRPGAYDVAVAVAGIGTLTGRMRFDPADDSEGVAAGYIRVRIFDHDEFSLHQFRSEDAP